MAFINYNCVCSNRYSISNKDANCNATKFYLLLRFPYKVPPMVMSLSFADEVINSLLLLYWFVPVYLVLLFFNQSVSRPPNHSNCPFIAGGPFASSDMNLTKPMVRWLGPSSLHSNLNSFFHIYLLFRSPLPLNLCPV